MRSLWLLVGAVVLLAVFMYFHGQSGLTVVSSVDFDHGFDYPAPVIAGDNVYFGGGFAGSSVWYRLNADDNTYVQEFNLDTPYVLSFDHYIVAYYESGEVRLYDVSSGSVRPVLSFNASPYAPLYPMYFDGNRFLGLFYLSGDNAGLYWVYYDGSEVHAVRCCDVYREMQVFDRAVYWFVADRVDGDRFLALWGYSPYRGVVLLDFGSDSASLLYSTSEGAFGECYVSVARRIDGNVFRLFCLNNSDFGYADYNLDSNTLSDPVDTPLDYACKDSEYSVSGYHVDLFSGVLTEIFKVSQTEPTSNTFSRLAVSSEFCVVAASASTSDVIGSASLSGEYSGGLASGGSGRLALLLSNAVAHGVLYSYVTPSVSVSSVSATADSSGTITVTVHYSAEGVGGDIPARVSVDSYSEDFSVPADGTEYMYTLGRQFDPGEYNVCVVLDPDNTLGDPDPSDNSACTSVTVPSPASGGGGGGGGSAPSEGQEQTAPPQGGEKERHPQSLSAIYLPVGVLFALFVILLIIAILR